jgi:hypothetical protein
MNHNKRIPLIALALAFACASPDVHATEYCLDGSEFPSFVSKAQPPGTFLLIQPGDLSPNADFPHLLVKPGKLANYTEKQKEKFERARRLMQAALNSEALKERILAHMYKGERRFSDNQGQSNEEIYATIRAGLEKGYTNEAYVAEFNHRLYYKYFSRVVGSVNIGNPWIRTNRKFFRPFSDAEVAGHLSHEWMHLLGYLHQETFPASVPYAVGNMVAEIAAQSKELPNGL